ncbi:hypothetical protein OHS33_30640 [Streptomyces sp. NBC_00536]|uniref:hypothetical protein n=1 Tax=Streptomyces sp. NBC_00536 TaxID=2975769 RepID=UPI002E818644|nr:hypothetical protein [Streptomyces sp. NBC_00536]WUC82327.1 hypothetical protein OHS33_30640 [Streptomyces sp. NBC_00536]
MESTTAYAWPRGAETADSEALERWLARHGWEVDPTVFMAGGLGPAVQVRRIGSGPDGEAGLLILPGETVEFAGARMRLRALGERATTGSGAARA